VKRVGFAALTTQVARHHACVPKAFDFDIAIAPSKLRVSKQLLEVKIRATRVNSAGVTVCIYGYIRR